MALDLNSSFGNYRIGAVIGEGGMGQVYLATDTTLDRKVALKVLPESFAADTDRIARFEREAKTLAALNHNNIAQIHGLESRDGVTAIVMELVEGPTLADRIAAGPVPPEEALRIARQIIDGLEAAHARGIVHRDLKPANIKVKADGLVKILDFGIAKSVESQHASGRHTPTMVTPAVTESGVIMGTAAYMSPEQARGKLVDQRADIWAFGCVLYEMLTGQPAFGGEDVTVVLARVLERDTDLSSMPGALSPAVRHTIKLCLQKDVKKRIADIRDVRLALAGVFDTGTTQFASNALAQPLWKKLVPIAASVVVTAIATSLVFLEAPVESEAVAEVRRSNMTLPQNQAFTAPNVRSVAVAEDDSKMVYAANGALYLRNMDELEARLLPGTEGETAITPYLSPDGKWIAYLNGGGGIKRVSVEGGTPLPVTTDFPNGGYTWLDNDNIIFSQRDQIWRVSANGGEPQLLVTEDPGYSTVNPKMLPGTDYVLYERTSAGGATSEVVVTSASSGEKHVLFPGSVPDYLPAGYLVYFDNSLGLLARAFDPQTLEAGSPIALVNDIYRAQANAGSAHFSVSNNGSLLYVKGKVNAGGSDFLGIGDETQILKTFDVPLGSYIWPRVSPDGAQVAVQSGQQLYVYRLDGSSEIRQLTRDGINIHPTWSPDGQYITYSSDRDGTRRIWQQRADGSGVAEPLTEGITDKPQTFPAWAPDGRLAYVAPNEGGEVDIWIVAIPLGEPEVLVGGVRNQYQPGFSADGQAIVYGSDESGTNQVFVAPFPPDGSSTRVSAAGVQSAYPFWSRQGGRLYYAFAGASGTGGRGAALDIAVPGFAVTRRQELPFTLLPDARRLDSPGFRPALPGPAQRPEQSQQQHRRNCHGTDLCGELD